MEDPSRDRPKQANSTVRRLLLLAASLAVGAFGWFLLGESEDLTAQEPPRPNVVARVGGVEVTAERLRELAAGDLLKLDRQRHQLLEQTARGEVENLLLAAEAEKRGITREQLIADEVESKVTPATQEEVDAFYEERQAQIRAPKEQVEDQIRAYLAQQGSQEIYQALIARLEESHAVEIFLEPFRVEVAADGPAKGGPEAAVTIVAFSDFECPFCSRVNPTIEKIHETYGDKVRVVFRQFPLDIHSNARKAGEASLCAHDQGKFWQMHDGMFADQKSLTADGLKSIAGTIDGLDGEAFTACLDSGRFADAVESDFQAGTRAGVSGTPAFFVNGRFLNGAQPYETFAEIIDDELSRRKES